MGKRENRYKATAEEGIEAREESALKREKGKLKMGGEVGGGTKGEEIETMCKR